MGLVVTLRPDDDEPIIVEQTKPETEVSGTEVDEFAPNLQDMLPQEEQEIDEQDDTECPEGRDEENTTSESMEEASPAPQGAATDWGSSDEDVDWAGVDSQPQFLIPDGPGTNMPQDPLGGASSDWGNSDEDLDWTKVETPPPVASTDGAKYLLPEHTQAPPRGLERCPALLRPIARTTEETRAQTLLEATFNKIVRGASMREIPVDSTRRPK